MIVPNMQHILKCNIKFSLNLGVYYVKFQVTTDIVEDTEILDIILVVLHMVDTVTITMADMDMALL